MASQGVFQHTAARRRLARWSVSNGRRSSFNTQPPEGGWAGVLSRQQRRDGFNTQPPEGGWTKMTVRIKGVTVVSTHSRPKAAGQ